MNRREHLLVILMEECNEVAHRASKALRFGLEEIQPGDEKTNAQRISDELNDLVGVAVMLRNEGTIDSVDPTAIAFKTAKVEKFLAYSKECGTLD